MKRRLVCPVLFERPEVSFPALENRSKSPVTDLVQSLPTVRPADDQSANLENAQVPTDGLPGHAVQARGNLPGGQWPTLGLKYQENPATCSM